MYYVPQNICLTKSDLRPTVLIIESIKCQNSNMHIEFCNNAKNIFFFAFLLIFAEDFYQVY